MINQPAGDEDRCVSWRAETPHKTPDYKATEQAQVIKLLKSLRHINLIQGEGQGGSQVKNTQ